MQQWLTQEAEERKREVLRKRLALPSMFHKRFHGYLHRLNPWDDKTTIPGLQLDKDSLSWIGISIKG